MFKKAQRLNKSEFSEFFKSGRKHNFPEATIITTPHPTWKVSVVVGKKVAKSAVRRNTIRRRINAQLRKLTDSIEEAKVLIVVVKPRYNSLTKKAADEFMTASIAQVIKSA